MSNAGQVLWSGIAIDDHAPAVAARLLEQNLFGGWGSHAVQRGGGIQPDQISPRYGLAA
jgi:glycogen debranching enzyme